ncbi:asparagine synthetase B [Mycolicibacterium pulveris]|uniref:asparagine synthase (glutamine-hydrolyzing) n=2 Tax=Mycolicibacterium pulveris TaxID=36813 RepID=A0A7I7UGR2_MYCPV|nr:asparagine synthetase B [Mycolicibacterium pulveris]
MCGLFATNDLSTRNRLPEILRARLAFRGPDWQSPVIEHKGWLLYHARLSIIAPTPEFSQPYITKSGGALLFNGEILNFATLAKQYGLTNSGSDTDILANLLELPGFDLNALEGFFAFIYLDSNGKMTHCARDRFGVKPLVYVKSQNNLAISSEASVLSDLYNLPHSQRALAEYKAFRAPIFTSSYFDGVAEVVPGTCLVNGPYFDTLDHVTDDYLPANDVQDALSETLQSAVRSRLVSDVPVGLLLSGGIDSNLIRAYSHRKFQCFTGGTENDYDVEYAESLGSGAVHIVDVSRQKFRTRFSEMIQLRKEPLSVPNEVILSFLAERWQKNGGRVLLSGEAADEFFGGYDRIFYWAANAERFCIDTFLNLYSYADERSIAEDIRADFEHFFRSLPGISPFESVRQFFLKKHLPVLFRRLDFALMYAGVEGREPFAHYEMFKLAMRIKPSQLFINKIGKRPLRELAAKCYGDKFAFEPKVGFPIDVGSIFGYGKTEDRISNYKVWRQENMRLIA